MLVLLVSLTAAASLQHKRPGTQDSPTCWTWIICSKRKRDVPHAPTPPPSPSTSPRQEDHTEPWDFLPATSSTDFLSDTSTSLATDLHPQKPTFNLVTDFLPDAPPAAIPTEDSAQSLSSDEASSTPDQDRQAIPAEYSPNIAAFTMMQKVFKHRLNDTLADQLLFESGWFCPMLFAKEWDVVVIEARGITPWDVISFDLFDILLESEKFAQMGGGAVWDHGVKRIMISENTFLLTCATRSRSAHVRARGASRQRCQLRMALIEEMRRRGIMSNNDVMANRRTELEVYAYGMSRLHASEYGSTVDDTGDNFEQGHVYPG